MTQNERLDYLLRYLLAEHKEYANIRVPDDLWKNGNFFAV